MNEETLTQESIDFIQENFTNDQISGMKREKEVFQTFNSHLVASRDEINRLTVENRLKALKKLDEALNEKDAAMVAAITAVLKEINAMVIVRHQS